MYKKTIVFVLTFFILLFAQQPGHKREIENKKRAFLKLSKALAASPNQQKFDVIYYRLNLDIQILQERIQGYVQMVARVVDGPINVIELNLHDYMTVDSVIADSGPLSFNHLNHILTVTLDKDYANNETISFKVYYQGDPTLTGSGAFVFTAYNSKPHFWTLSEPYGAREWWPCKDVPEDKADSVDIIVRVPDGMSVASNGLIVSEQSDGVNTTFHWKERYPIVTYLVSLAGYEYTRYSDTYQTMDGGTMPIDFFVYPEHYQNSDFRDNYARTKDMITAFAGYFGEYPFVTEKYGHAEFLWGGGMEHQTCSSLDGYGTGLIAHELGHQWWGDMITCQDFHHIWLNEGFATYCEALWREYDEGMAAYHDEMAANEYKGPGTIYVEDDTDENEIFDGNLSYSKASWVLHMLRHVVGDSVFFDILHTYYADSRYQYGTAVTEDFQGVCESVSGMNLDKFFQQWIYGEYYPQYEYSWSSAAEGNQYRISLSIDQTQTNTGLFWMPIDVYVQTAAGDTTFVVWDSLQTQQFDLFVNDEPASVQLDTDKWILRDVTEVTSALANATNSYPSRDFRIIGAYPNPFNPVVTMEFFLDERSPVSVEVYDNLGRRIAKLAEHRIYNSGIQRIKWNAGEQASGVYFVAIKKENAQKLVKVLLVK